MSEDEDSEPGTGNRPGQTPSLSELATQLAEVRALATTRRATLFRDLSLGDVVALVVAVVAAAVAVVTARAEANQALSRLADLEARLQPMECRCSSNPNPPAPDRPPLVKHITIDIQDAPDAPYRQSTWSLWLAPQGEEFRGQCDWKIGPIDMVPGSTPYTPEKQLRLPEGLTRVKLELSWPGGPETFGGELAFIGSDEHSQHFEIQWSRGERTIRGELILDTQ